MSHLPAQSTPKNLRYRAFRTVATRACGLGIFSLLLLLWVSTAAAQSGTTILSSDFEDGSTQGWVPRGTAVLTNTTDAAHSGIRSLLTTGRTAGFNGPSIDMTGKIVKGTLYQVTGWVRLVPGQAADTLKITMQRNLGSSSNCASFDTIAASPANGVTDSGWVMLQGQYLFSSEATQLIMYVEAAGATTQYYLDDVSVVQIARDDSGITSGFEDGTTEGWFERAGGGTLSVSTAAAHSGTSSLFSSGRTQPFQGPAIDVTNKMYNGSQYAVNVWAMLGPGEADTPLRVSMEIDSPNGPSFFTVIGNQTVTSGAWVQFSGNFTVPAGGTSASLYVESATGTPSFYIDDVQVSFVPPPIVQDIEPLHQPFDGKFLLGGALLTTDIVGPKTELLKRHINSITAGNDMKWDATEPTEGNFNFNNADKLVCFAQAFNMGIRGHTLVWHNQVPNWVFLDANGVDMSTEPPSEANKQLLLSRLDNHIRNVVGHFKGQIYAWDVVNEVIDESQPDGFRRSKWFLIAGEDYIARAFQDAHEADPAAKLYINDFNTTIPAKRAFLLALAQKLKESGVPIDGIGHQFHNNVDFPISDDPSTQQTVIDTLNMVTALGLDNQVTEFDVSIYSGPNPTIYANYADIPQDLHVKVGYRYRDYFQIFRKMADQISSVTIWGEADDDTWLTFPGHVDAPVPFDIHLQAKPAYFGIVDPLQLPGADLAAHMNVVPRFVKSGQLAAYFIQVKNNGHDPAATVTLTDALPANTTFSWIKAPAGWSCTTPARGSSGTVSCTAPAMADGAKANFFLAVNVACGTPSRTQIVNSVTVGSTTRDPNPAPNNTASATITVFGRDRGGCH